MTPIESITFWTTVILLALSTALYLFSFIFQKDKGLKVAGRLMLVGYVFLTVTIIVRMIATGHIPTVGKYENGLAGAWFIGGFTLWSYYGKKGLKGVPLFTLPLSLLILGYGVMSNPTLAPLSAGMKSFWLYIHVFFAWLAYGAFTLCFGIAILYLLKNRSQSRETQERTSSFWGRFPELAVIDELMFRYLVYGFIADAIMIAAGSIWAKDLWGSYWSWDPVEVWSLVSWLIYGLAIHLRVTMGWRGKKMAWVLIFALIGVLIVFWGTGH